MLHNIPIPFDCQDDNCGSCVVEVSHLHAPTKYSKYGISLTEEEEEAEHLKVLEASVTR